MKKINLSLNDDDIKAISCALEVMVSYPIYESESERNAAYMLSVSSGKKNYLPRTIKQPRIFICCPCY